MRRHLAALLMIAVLAFPGAVMADGSSLDLGLGYHYYDYREDLTLPLKSTESGWLPSVYASYAYRWPFLYTRLYGDFAGGELTFDGSTQGGTPVRFTDSLQRFFKIEWNIGYVQQVGEKFQLTPFIGYGYRYWLRGRARNTPTFSTFEEEYQWSYLPAGLKADYAINGRWGVAATMAVNFMFNGKMKAKMSQILAGAGDLDLTLGNEPGFYAELPVTCRLTPNWAIVGTPWYEYSQIGRSNSLNITQNNSVVGFAFEPPSRTHQYGFRVGASYSF